MGPSLGMSASDKVLNGPPRSFRVLATASLADRVVKFSSNTLLTEGFVRVNDFPDLEFPWGKALIECSGPSN